MKTFKKFICIFLIVVMCLTSAPLDGFDMFDFSAWFANKASAIGELETTGQCGDNAYWELNIDTGELVVSGTGLIRFRKPDSEEIIEFRSGCLKKIQREHEKFRKLMESEK